MIDICQQHGRSLKTKQAIDGIAITLSIDCGESASRNPVASKNVTFAPKRKSKIPKVVGTKHVVNELRPLGCLHFERCVPKPLAP